ncbi:twin-arginine translocase TatA/TatE family subunit [Paradesulfitobacterium ferrireducens]|uniref:twin-arginine translocase TatA/TatE family subunit n=1 Tax=Paradesulfitobacterium ferrireducens TaxID=2816476 RepID=UPI001A8D456C|nr:twin-arginine translocase TatA/TatE family subunit [Paradesulfitobacterium ferrireducens]
MSLSEIIIIMAIALILFGPEDLPDIARMLGRIIYEIRKAVNDLTSEFEDVVKEPAAMMNKALDDITKPGRSAATGIKTDLESNQAGGQEALEKTLPDDEELLSYDDDLPVKADPASDTDDPLAQLPSDMVSYEEEIEEAKPKEQKGSSR